MPQASCKAPSENTRLNRAHMRPAMFLDCDGVLNVETGEPGVVTPDEVKLIPGAGAALKRARAAGLLTVAVTNRPRGW